VAIFGAAIPARALNEPTWWGRTLGVIGVGLAGALLLAINWGAAKFRDIAAAGGDIESALQVAKLLSAEWNLTVPGLAAFCFGMANGIYVWVRTSKAFDPVMGLERHVQMHQDKLDAVHELEANIDGRLSQILDRTVAYGRDKPVIISAELKRLRAEATALLIKRQRNEDLETSDLKALVGSIDLYRKTNTFVRGDKVIPVCLQGDVDVSGLTRDYGSLDDIVATIESKTVTQKQAADTWVKQVNGLADIVGEIKEQAPHILQAIAQHDVEQGPVPELKAIREKFRKLGEAEGSDAETTGGGWVDTDGGEPWGIEQRVGA
jgi:hypothetical protein